jgi:hypothetical protein
MKKKGFVESKLEEKPEGKTGPARRVFWVTGYGAGVLEAHKAFLASMLAARKLV